MKKQRCGGIFFILLHLTEDDQVNIDWAMALYEDLFKYQLEKVEIDTMNAAEILTYFLGNDDNKDILKVEMKGSEVSVTDDSKMKFLMKFQKLMVEYNKREKVTQKEDEAKEKLTGYEFSGHCAKCGAPYYLPTVWHGIIPPQPTPTCNCWNTGTISTTTDTTTLLQKQKDEKTKN